MVAGSIGPSHGFVHVVDIAGPVEIFGMPVTDGDLVHADRHGAVAIPAEVLPTLEDAIKTLIASEDIILGPIKEGPVDMQRFETLWAAFERART